MAFRKKNKPFRSDKVRYIGTRSDADPTVAILLERVEDLMQRLERLERKGVERVRDLTERLERLEQKNKVNTEWMKISDAVKHPSLVGRLSQKQIRTQIFNSIEDPITATFIVNVHYQLLRCSSYRSYVVNPSAIAKLLEAGG